MEQIFRHMHAAYMSLESRLKAEGFKLRVLQVFKAWEEWAVYQRDFLTKLKHIFLGIPSVSMKSLLLQTTSYLDERKVTSLLQYR